MQHVTLNVPKMSCGHCKMTIEDAGSALPGVKSIVADLETKAVEVSFDENVVALEDIKNALAQAGYPPE